MSTFAFGVNERGPHSFVVTATGELDMDHAGELAGDLDRLITAGALVVLDASSVTFMDSMGLSTLLLAAARARTVAASFRLAAPRAAVRRLIDMTGVSTILDVRDDVRAALAA